MGDCGPDEPTQILGKQEMLGYLEAIKNPRGNNPVAMTFDTMEHYRIKQGFCGHCQEREVDDGGWVQSAKEVDTKHAH